MTHIYFHRMNVKLNHGVVVLPKELSSTSTVIKSYPKRDDYLLEEFCLDGYRFLFIFPKGDVTKENLRINDPIISWLPDSIDLERLVNEDGGLSFQLPKSSLQYIGLRKNSWARILVNANGQIVVWNPKDFEWGYNASGNPTQQ